MHRWVPGVIDRFGQRHLVNGLTCLYNGDQLMLCVNLDAAPGLSVSTKASALTFCVHQWNTMDSTILAHRPKLYPSMPEFFESFDIAYVLTDFSVEFRFRIEQLQSQELGPQGC